MQATTTTTPTDRPAPATPFSRATRRAMLAWAFCLFNTARVLAYLPTMWAIHGSGDSSQHSLWTWCIWLGANTTMALWLHEENGGRVTRPMLVSCANAVLCAGIVLLILCHR